MIGYVENIEKQTLKNNYFRQVLFTAKNAQLVVMCLQPGEEIGDEVHPKVDQFFRIEQGEAKFIFKERGVASHGKGGKLVVVPRGLRPACCRPSKPPPNDRLNSNEKEEHVVHDGEAVIVPAGTFHNVINTGKGQLKLYTIYSPPNHPDGTVHKTKAEAEKAEKEH